jgi:flagellar biosynthesis protein FlhF
MQVKKYRAKTIKEATSKVKDVLGSDAMIISTNKLKGKDGHNYFEIAAVPAGKNNSDCFSNPFNEVKSELMSIKEMIGLLNHSGRDLEKLVMVPDILNLYSKLIKNGVKDHCVRLFMERAGILNGHPPDPMNGIKKKVINEIKRAIVVKDIFEEKANKQTIAAFIGTTGVGKTTTVAKLAAQLSLKAQKRVGLISTDTYRIGGMEQLKTYANILGVPCFQAFKKKDLLFALSRMEGKDVILIDTAGQSQYDRARIEELRGIMPGELAVSTHLLMSVATTEAEMNVTAINFSPLKFSSYIFTKIDETERCGSIINQTMKLSLPVSYITTGQNVPEDIEQADKRKILKLLLS